eukprot:NODE_319_length_11107_cov_0.311228.p7 type:complete len:111 gc:universal NODE_319_length_11107_cov_0.311228:7423-7755(+)
MSDIRTDSSSLEATLSEKTFVLLLQINNFDLYSSLFKSMYSKSFWFLRLDFLYTAFFFSNISRSILFSFLCFCKSSAISLNLTFSLSLTSSFILPFKTSSLLVSISFLYS